MEMSHKKTFNRRKSVSVGLFLTLACLVVTGVLIQIFEAFEKDFPIHVATAIHVLTGVVFTVFSVLHIIINWRVMKTYINKSSKK